MLWQNTFDMIELDPGERRKRCLLRFDMDTSSFHNEARWAPHVFDGPTKECLNICLNIH